MVKTILATFRRGQLAPAEPLPLEEGEQVRVRVETLPDARTARERFLASAGAWADQLDCDEFERAVYERRHRPRPATRL